jgi:YD repeat-containing protein
MEAFTYSASAPSDIDFDTCASHDKRKTYTGHVTLNRREIRPPGSSPASAYTVFEVDEIGRLTETDFDRLHRVVACREFTGFCTPNVPVTSSSNRPTGKLRDSDPAYFETTCAYNADSLCTRVIRPDGSQELVTYDRDFRQNCPVRERANPRVISLRAAGPAGELRTVTCDYQPDFGTPEWFLPGNPIKGMTVKGGRNPGGDIVNSLARKGWDGSIKGNMRKGWDGSVKGNLRKGWDGSVKGKIVKEEGGRHTPFHNKYRPQSTGGVVAAIVAAVCSAGEDEDCDGDCDDGDDYARIGPKQKAWLCSNFRTRMVNAHGQVSSWSHDTKGNRTSYTSALPNKGNLYQYDAQGRCTRSTTLNGQGSSFIDDFVYGTDGFLSSVTSDSTGLHLATSFGRDPQGRVTSVTDPRGGESLFDYNPLHQCIQIQSPLLPSDIAGTPPFRITTDFTIDNGGSVLCGHTSHLRPNGSPDPVNPAYSTFFVRDDRGRLVRVAEEERPVDGSSTLDPSSLGIENFMVCDFTYDDAGQLTRLSTPAVCRNQSSDLACAFTYDERGLLHRCIVGDTGDPKVAGTVTTERDYDSLGALVRCATLGSGVAGPQTLFAYDGFHRLLSTTDPMGNIFTYDYANNGSVTTSVYGELDDQPGSAGNVLLSRATARFSFGDLGGDSNDPVCLDLPGVGDVCYGIDVKSSAFFTVETEDDTVTVERFTPGSTAPPATEVTVVDRSPAGLVQSVVCNGDLLMSCEYDTAGRKIRCADGSCITQATLDACGDVVAVVRTDISAVNGVASKTFTTSCVRDSLGRMTSCTAGSGNTSSIEYDSLGRPVSFTAPGRPPLLYAYDGGVADGAFSVQVSCDISSTGSPVVLSSSLVRAGECRSITDANGQTDFLSRDPLGRVTGCAHPDGTSDATTFDSLGRPTLQQFKDQSLANHTFDLNGRPTLTTWTGVPPVVPSNALSIQYDGLGRQVRCEQGSSVLVMTYDSCGNPTSESQNGRLVSRTFNHRGRTGITYPDGRLFNESRSAPGQLLAITNSSGGNVVTMGYAGHRVVRSVQGNGVITTWSYRGDTDVAQGDFSFDECVRSTVSVSSVVLSDERVFRDRSQSVTRCETRFASGADAPYRSKAFTLDGLGRITACVTERRETTGGPVVPESSVSYVLGSEGHRISQLRNGVGGDYTQSDLLPPGDFQMGQYTTWPGSSLPLQWDDNGNLSVMTRGTTQLDFVHNDQGQLVAVNDATNAPATSVLTYTYDALGRRASRTSLAGGASVSTTFVYDGAVCIQELGVAGLADLTIVSGGGIQHCVSTRNGTNCYPHGGGGSSGMRWKAPELNSNSDQHVALVTDANGAVLERFDCDDACKPVFLTSDGLPSSATSSSSGLRWLSPACAWEPEIGMFTCPGGVCSPDLGRSVSATQQLEYRGHVTVLK